jgi:antitoxin (DNA-binding transcriptional repressor) of toxin-antitoxin stability system
MEKSYGIEAARAQLGDIAEHARTTGNVIALTRHGRTVAVIGPANAVRPAQGVQVTLHFPHVDWTVHMPIVPRKGELIDWQDPDHGNAVWKVTAVEYTVYPDEPGPIDIMVDPADDDARQQATEK